MAHGDGGCMTPRIGLALGTGGARGWCHIGVLRALADMGLQVDAIAGSSMGALVGAAHAGGRLDALEDWARALTPRAVWGLVDMRLTGGGLVGGASVARMLDEIGLDGAIEDLGLPLTAVAADLSSGREVWLQRGPVGQATRASVAIPGVLRPVELGGRWLIDGGVVNPVPVSPLHAAGVDIVIAVNPNGAPQGHFWTAGDDWPGLPDMAQVLSALPGGLPEAWRGHAAETAQARPPSYIAVINATIDIMSDRIRRARLAADAPQVLVTARLDHFKILQFHRAGEAIAEGYRAMMAQRPLLDTLLGR